MQLVPGGIYAISLQLSGANNVGPSWLVGAFATKLPGADVVNVEQYTGFSAVVSIRWRKSVPGELAKGTVIHGAIEGLILPDQVVPKGTVVDVQYGGATMPSLEQQLPDSVKMVAAGAIIATTWYFSRRIKEKHGRSATSSARATAR